jgi:hypothetical protein
LWWKNTSNVLGSSFGNKPLPKRERKHSSKFIFHALISTAFFFVYDCLLFLVLLYRPSTHPQIPHFPQPSLQRRLPLSIGRCFSGQVAQLSLPRAERPLHHNQENGIECVSGKAAHLAVPISLHLYSAFQVPLVVANQISKNASDASKMVSIEMVLIIFNVEI